MPEDHRLRKKRRAILVERPPSLALTRRLDEKKPSESMKAAIVAALSIGQPAAQIAQRFNLPLEIVRQWEKAYDITNAIERKNSISDKIFAFVEQEIASLMAISIATSDEDWIKDQDAEELAEYVSIKYDRLMAVLGAYGKAQSVAPRLVEENNGGD